MIKFLKKVKKEREEKNRKILQIKFYELRHWITKFFEDLQVTKGSVELPAWIECKNLMEKLKINMDNPKNINFYYRRLQKYKLANNL